MQRWFVGFYDLHAAFLYEVVGNNYMEQASFRSQYAITFSSNSSQVMKPIDDRCFHMIAAPAVIRNQMNQAPRLILCIWDSF